MLSFAVINRRGLRFIMKAESREKACRAVANMLGKRSVPWHITVAYIV